MSELSGEVSLVQSEGSLARVAGSLKCLTGTICTGIKDYWPLLLSSGLLYLEIRHLRDEIKALQGRVFNLVILVHFYHKNSIFDLMAKINAFYEQKNLSINRVEATNLGDGAIKMTRNMSTCQIRPTLSC